VPYAFATDYATNMPIIAANTIARTEVIFEVGPKELIAELDSSAAFSTGALTDVGAGAPASARALFTAASPRLLFTDLAEAASLT